MKKLLIKIAFNGRDYCGFQWQKNGITIQEKLNGAANALFSRKCMVTGCSRTDSGVHSNGFCATIVPADVNAESVEWCKIPADKIRTAFNIHLPQDISVIDTAFVDFDFHPRYDVEYKEYIYKITNDEIRNPFEFGLTYRIPRYIPDKSFADMREAAQNFVGAHDFRAFMAFGSKITDTVRDVKYADLDRTEDGKNITFKVAADGFLYNMVRIMMGTLIDVSFGKKSPGDIIKIIESRERRNAGITVPPDGLYLNKVEYKEKIHWHIGA